MDVTDVTGVTDVPDVNLPSVLQLRKVSHTASLSGRVKTMRLLQHLASSTGVNVYTYTSCIHVYTQHEYIHTHNTHT